MIKELPQTKRDAIQARLKEENSYSHHREDECIHPNCQEFQYKFEASWGCKASYRLSKGSTTYIDPSNGGCIDFQSSIRVYIFCMR